MSGTVDRELLAERSASVIRHLDRGATTCRRTRLACNR